MKPDVNINVMLQEKLMKPYLKANIYFINIIVYICGSYEGFSYYIYYQ